MKYLFYVLFISKFFESTEGQCSGGIWPIQNPSIGSFSISWRYNIASNTVQFIIQGQAIASINLASTYIAIGWSDTAPSMNNMDVAMYFPTTGVVQDRYSRGHITPSIDSQQDFCIIRTNTSDQNIYVAFERFVTTGDTNDINFISNLYLMFAMGTYTPSSDPNNYNPQYHFYRTPYSNTVNLLNCVSIGCLTTNCPIASCPCLQQITSNLSQCVCFPPSSCVSGSTVTAPRTIQTSLTTTLSTTASSTINNNPCQNPINPCSSNGFCLQTSATQFICQCKNNYTGVLCQTPLFSNNNSCTCFNGATCLINGTCLCSNNYRGKFCQLNDPCVIFCRNNGICSVNCTDISCNSPTCTCMNGYTGLQCEMMIGSGCQSNTCMNGNCIMTTNGTYQCQCWNGYLGTRCDMINSCSSNPCNQGTCLPSSNCLGIVCDYLCVCPNGTTGKNCEIGANPCLSNPCKNGGNCIISSNSYLCQCIPPYGGTNCDLIINVCTPNPCFNNGLCIRSTNISDGTYRCECMNNYIGPRCEYLSGCINSPCRNNGQCLATTRNCSSGICAPSCVCSNGTTGTYCEQQLPGSSCTINTCLNGGTCLMNPMINTVSCQCPLNTNGIRCETIQLISCTNATCSNNGTCYIDGLSGTNTVRCLCSSGYTGQYCQTLLNFINVCTQNPCGYNGTCIPTSNLTYYCICPNGITGQSCPLNSFTSCSDSPCHYLSKCQQISSTNSSNYQCICPDYLTGDRCQYTNSCQKQPCYNQGSCIPLGPQHNFMCLCQRGFGHYDCSIYLGLTCNPNICLSGGTCDFNSTTIRCICPTGFAGARCEWTSVCSTNTCLNGGTCRQTAATMAECLCATGFTGPTCSLRDACTNFPCKNGGACTNLLTNTATVWSAYRCTCPSAFYGQNCDIPRSSCASMLCPAYQICNEQPTGPVCTCAGSKVGTFCQYDNPCGISSIFCANGGTCISTNTDPPVGVCLCRSGFTGPYCNVTTQNDLCANNPCQTRGYCALSSSNTSYSCICQSNYIGDQCERSNPCSSSPCLNQGLCQGFWNQTNTWFICRCIDTYTGTRCETSLLNPCGGLCMNGSPCVNGVCVCPAQYTGKFCGFDNLCNKPICLNSGFCSSNFNSTSASFTCTCSSFYTGQYCENPINVQLLPATSCIPSCMNGGSCVNGLCMCTSQFTGSSCQYRNPCINSNTCLNNATCFGQYNINGSTYIQCFCSQGYTGVYCEATLCSSTSCNGGSCTAAQNTFVCTCPMGKVGDRCQYADACANNPCLPTERCEQTENRYQCVACYDKSSFCSAYQSLPEYCDVRYSILINNTAYSVPDACQRSCNKCTSNQRLDEMNNDDNTTIYNDTETFSTSTIPTPVILVQNIIFSRTDNCFDKRDDCSLQKAYGFCEVFNEKYPYDCMKTCHPDCAF